MPRQLTVPEAAKRLGVSTDTIKRRLRRGELQGKKKPTAQGHVWLIEVDDDDEGGELRDATAAAIGAKDETIAVLRQQLDARTREVERLHILLQQALQRPALPAPPTDQEEPPPLLVQAPGQAPQRPPWWARWWQELTR